MCGDKDTALFLQKARGYTLTGDVNAYNSFYILYGKFGKYSQKQGVFALRFFSFCAT